MLNIVVTGGIHNLPNYSSDDNQYDYSDDNLPTYSDDNLAFLMTSFPNYSDDKIKGLFQITDTHLYRKMLIYKST